MFTKRGTVGIHFVGPYTPGKLINRSVADGDSVDLRLGEERVLVRDIHSIGDQRFRGVIYGFEPSFGTEFNNLRLDQEIEFIHDEIHGCVHR